MHNNTPVWLSKDLSVVLRWFDKRLISEQHFSKILTRMQPGS